MKRRPLADMAPGNKNNVGISGIALDVPPYRVKLDDWCEWTGSKWDKIRQVVGHGFRLPGPRQSVYTMAANAVLRLIERYEIDPSMVQYLALGTESSTDNSAGAVIVKGMVDKALKLQGRSALSRNCEVPEFKQACLGGIYGLKNAVRFLNVDGDGAKAIVVCSDIALYERGSSGEPTQGSGAVAFLIETDPQLASINLQFAGTASDYRGIDFRKPIQHRNDGGHAQAFKDTPVFNGKYSATCYVDEMLRALEHLYEKRQLNPADYLRRLEAVFMHRPFQRMPETGWGMAYLFSLGTGNIADHDELRGYCEAADQSLDAVLAEMRSQPNVPQLAVRERINEEAFPITYSVLKTFRQSDAFKRYVLDKIRLGIAPMQELGNLYTGALPAWLAAGFEQALAENLDLTGKEILLLGYGSGDAADAIPLEVTAGWREATAKIKLADALEKPIDLSAEQYLAFREGAGTEELGYEPAEEFVVERIGSQTENSFQDAGIEYYRYIP